VQLRQETLVWTDTALYSLQYIGGQEVFGIKLLASNISIASSRAVSMHNDEVYWMGRDKFYAYDGRVSELRCGISNFVFSGITDYSSVHSGLNLAFDEVVWYYMAQTPAGGVETHYALYNYSDDVWANGTHERTMWYDTGGLTVPYAADGTALYQQELGNDGVEWDTVNTQMDTVAIVNYAESAEMDVAEGDYFSFITRLIPDVDFSGAEAGSSMYIRMEPRRAPGATVGTNSLTVSEALMEGSAITPYTERVGLRLRARQIRLVVGSVFTGDTWALGTQRIDAKPNGMK
jgi:hypothetical protein